MFGVQVESSARLRVVAGSAGPSARLQIAARTDPVTWHSLTPDRAGRRPTWHAALAPGSYVCTIDFDDAKGPIDIEIDPATVMVTIPETGPTAPSDVVAFVCARARTGNPKDPWPPPPPPPGRVALPPDAARWFAEQLLPGRARCRPLRRCR